MIALVLNTSYMIEHVRSGTGYLLDKLRQYPYDLWSGNGITLRNLYALQCKTLSFMRILTLLAHHRIPEVYRLIDVGIDIYVTMSSDLLD